MVSLPSSEICYSSTGDDNRKNIRKQQLLALAFFSMLTVSLHPLLPICEIEKTLGLGEMRVSHRNVGQESLFFKWKAVGFLQEFSGKNSVAESMYQPFHLPMGRTHWG